MSWPEVHKVNDDMISPINHLVWLNDYSTHSTDSYVYVDKNKLHELYKDYPLSMNDNGIFSEALDYIIEENTEIGTALNYVYGVDDDLSEYATQSDISNNFDVTEYPVLESRITAYGSFEAKELFHLNTVDITLTINGAKEDVITITDSNGDVVPVTIGGVTGNHVVFATGATSATGVVITVPYSGGVYTFTSTVAKALDGSSNNYSKNVTLTNTLAQSVDVFPDVTPYWYQKGSFTASNNKPTETAIAVTPTITQSINSISATISGNGEIGGAIYPSAIDVTNLSHVKIRCSATTGGYEWSVVRPYLLNTVNESYHYARVDSIVYKSIPTYNGDFDIDVSSLSGTKYLFIALTGNSSVPPQPIISIEAVWGE